MCLSPRITSRGSTPRSRLRPRNGWIDRKAAHLEALTSMVRAGADIVLTYAALDLARWLGEES